MQTALSLNPTQTRTCRRRAGLAGLAAVAPLAALLAGCAGNMPSNFGTGGTSTTTATVHMSGSVYGGQQPVAGATLQLLTVGTTGIGSASTYILTSTVTTDAGGNFSLTGKYSCGSATQVYLVATGGNPGAGTNPNLALAAALGSCATLLANANTTFINMNEVTTVAAAYALAPFATDFAHIGATGANPTGLVNAFANAAALANTTTGLASGTNVPSSTVVPTAELNTLANILASCVNSTGAASSTCNTLFTATGATDTFGAALAIAKNPGASAITALYALSNNTAPFQPTLSQQPNDFTVALSFTPSNPLATPYGIAIDASGDAWITNESGTTVTELSPRGAFLAGIGTGGTNPSFGPQGVAIDPSGNVWLANTAGNSVVKLAVTSGQVTGNGNTTAGVSTPSAIAIDSAGRVFVTNLNGNSVAGFTNAGVPLSGSPFTGGGNITVPTAIAVGPGGYVYVTSGNGSAVKLTNAGAYSATYTDSTLQGPAGLAVDPSSRVFLAGFTTGSAVAGGVSEFSSAGVPALTAPVSSGIASPAGAASDGTSVWVANSTASGSLARLTYGTAASASPATGFGSLNMPIGVAIDGTGSVWTTNSGSNTVSKFVGIAVPVTTPLSSNTAFVGP